jgi:hypothetical protein
MKKAIVVLFSICLLAGFVTHADAGMNYGLSASDFSSATVETFSNSYVRQKEYDFGNGMRFTSGWLPYINYAGSYGMGTEPSVSGGLGGSGGFLGTYSTPSTFDLSFSSGIGIFGFYGAEAKSPDNLYGKDGEFTINFYDTSDNLLDSFLINTLGTHAWDQFHGFSSTDSIGRVEFYDVGHSVYDNVSFGATVAPEPVSSILFLIGVATLGFRRLRKRG